MPIREVRGQTARARVSCLRLLVPVREAAISLAKAQEQSESLLVPYKVELDPIELAQGPRDYVEQAHWLKGVLAARLGLEAEEARRLSFLRFGRAAWCLGPRRGRETQAPLAGVEAAPDRFVQLMLLKAILERGARREGDLFVTGAFGAGAYLGSLGTAGGRRLQLVEVDYRVNLKHGHVLCDVHNKVFVKKAGALESDAASSIVDAGEGMLMTVTRLAASGYRALDAREHPLVGVSLHKERFRHSRLYYLNLVTEFAHEFLSSCGIPCQYETFEATHCVEDGFVPLEPLASLQRPLVVASSRPVSEAALRPLQNLPVYFPAGFHVAGNRKAQFRQLVVAQATSQVREVAADLNYLFLNTVGEQAETSITVDGEEANAADAYDAVASGKAEVDPYTRLKFLHVLDCPTVKGVMQGLNFGPDALEAIQPASTRPDDRKLQEALKRCLVELSLKECLIGVKPVPMPAFPVLDEPLALTLLATRTQKQSGRRPPKQLVAVVEVHIQAKELRVLSVRRTPWSSDSLALLDFLQEFPFLSREAGRPIDNDQFWALDRQTGHRLRVWAGAIVPRILLNDTQPSVEAALSAPGAAGEGAAAKYYSKNREFNLLPYYMGFFTPPQRGERPGSRIAVQDRGSFLRVFVPPEGGLVGGGDALSGLRDVMVYGSNGEPVTESLLEHRLAVTFLHTLTNGVLVGGDNSKMSVLEKLARLALLN